jgi:hypothetical protein
VVISDACNIIIMSVNDASRIVIDDYSVTLQMWCYSLETPEASFNLKNFMMFIEQTSQLTTVI